MGGDLTLHVRDGSYAIVASGFAEGPAQALRDYLLRERARRVVMVAHPLVDEGDTSHEVAVYEGGELMSRRRTRLPFKPPYTYPLDVLVPLVPPRCDVWFGFNNLAAAHGLAARAAQRCEQVVYWCVDFVEDRFGGGTLTKVYDGLDRAVCRRVDLRVELSEAGLRGRDRRLELREAAPAVVVPMGAWLDRVPTTSPDAWRRRRVVFLGHLVPRMGVDTLIESAALLASDDELSVEIEVIGRGPELERLRELASARGVAARTTFHGFVEDHRRVEEILAGASIAAAPYADVPDSFTRNADPGKLKAYLAAGLPMVLTPVPPNAAELSDEAGAVLVSDDPRSVADGIVAALASAEGWQGRREAALSYATRFDWPALLARALAPLGIAP